MEIVHVDIVLLTNFAFTALIIWFVGSLWGLKASTSRIFLVAFLSTLYLIFILFLDTRFLLFYIIGHIALSVIMAKVTWQVQKWRNVAKYVLTMYGVAFLWGGVATAFWNMFYTYRSLAVNILSLLFVLILGIFSGHKMLGFLQKKQMDKGEYFIRINLYGKEKVVRAFIDTGHILKGLAGETVVIVSWEIIRSLLESFLVGTLFSKPADLLIYLPASEQEKIKLIPYTSIGVDWGTMLAISSAKVELIVNGKGVEIENCLLALYEGKIHHGYKALLPAEIRKIPIKSYD